MIGEWWSVAVPGVRPGRSGFAHDVQGSSLSVDPRAPVRVDVIEEQAQVEDGPVNPRVTTARFAERSGVDRRTDRWR